MRTKWLRMIFAVLLTFNLSSPLAWAASNHGRTSATFATNKKSSGIKIVSFTQDVNPGDVATIEVQTTPDVTGYIEVDYYSGRSQAQGLAPERANKQGYITWSWMVGTRTYPGNWPVYISVGGKTIQTTLHVTKAQIDNSGTSTSSYWPQKFKIVDKNLSVSLSANPYLNPQNSIGSIDYQAPAGDKILFEEQTPEGMIKSIDTMQPDTIQAGEQLSPEKVGNWKITLSDLTEHITFHFVFRVRK